jgi:uncharacterized small protein (DUF1192 family)|tara:strand:+ start:653 stop:1006 length:354 start_codon:yes stop_codon:yes gene_type:complete
MAEIKIQKTVFNKPEFDDVIDRDFKFFTPPEDLEDNDTVSELFRLYNKLYFEIPLRNSNTSHEYLIRKSLELVDFEEDNERIQPLLDEITNLRAQLVDNQETILELQLQNISTNTDG